MKQKSMKGSVRIGMVLILVLGLTAGNLVWAAENVTWKLNTYLTRTTGSPHGQALEQLAAGVKKASNGKFVINVYLSGELGIKSRNALGPVNEGVIELNQGSSSYYYQEINSMKITKFPFLAPDQESYIKIQKVVLPYMAEELQSKYAVSALFAVPFTANTLFTKEKVNFFDMKGTKLRVPGGMDTEAVSLLNAVGVPISMGEVYQAIEKGVVAGFESDVTNIPALKLWEVLKYCYSLPLLNSSSVIIMSTKAYNKLPKDLQKILDAEVAKLYPTYYENLITLAQKAKEKCKANGMEFVLFTKADFARAQKLAQPLWAKHAATFGPVGKKAWADVQKVMATFK